MKKITYKDLSNIIYILNTKGLTSKYLKTIKFPRQLNRFFCEEYYITKKEFLKDMQECINFVKTNSKSDDDLLVFDDTLSLYLKPEEVLNIYNEYRKSLVKKQKEDAIKREKKQYLYLKKKFDN